MFFRLFWYYGLLKLVFSFASSSIGRMGKLLMNLNWGLFMFLQTLPLPCLKGLKKVVLPGPRWLKMRVKALHFQKQYVSGIYCFSVILPQLWAKVLFLTLILGVTIFGGAQSKIIPFRGETYCFHIKKHCINLCMHAANLLVLYCRRNNQFKVLLLSSLTNSLIWF